MTPLERFCDIIRTEMDLEDDQVYLWDQKIKPLPDQRLYVTVGVASVKPFSNTRNLVPNGSVLNEVLSTNVKATLSIDITSRGPDARDRKEEVVLALNSIYSQQQQEAFGFYIAPISTSFTNLSVLDGAAIPYRFNISVALQYKVTKTKAVPFYDTFTDTVTTDP